MGKLYRRHFFLTATMILVSFAILGLSFIALSYRYTMNERSDTLSADADYVAELTATAVENGSNLQDNFLQLYLYSVSLISDADVIITGTDGAIVYFSNGEGKKDLFGSVISDSMVSQCLQSKGYCATTDLGIYSEKHFVSGSPIEVETSAGTIVIGLALVAAKASSITEMWRMFTVIFLTVALVVMCIACLSSYFTSMHESRPLQEMSDAVRRFGQGEFDVRVNDCGRKDEVGQLALAFNAMADSLAQSETRRQEFVANISHELKTPMTTIAGFTDGILDGTIPSEKAPEYLQVVSSETRRLSRLVRKMLDISKLQAKDTVTGQEQFDLCENLCQMLISLEGKINARKLNLDVQLPEEQVMVWGEPDAITQVGYNLMDNAIKFSPEGGMVNLSVTTKDGKAYISVRNRGETIAPAELSLIFDRFHKTDRSRSMDKDGVGLGLYIVKTIINNHKEDITVTSEDGITTFTFTLTLAR